MSIFYFESAYLVCVRILSKKLDLETFPELLAPFMVIIQLTVILISIPETIHQITQQLTNYNSNMQEIPSNQNLLIDCLNGLEHALNKLDRIKPNNQIQQTLKSCRYDLKLYLQSTQINQQMFSDMASQIHQLQKQKDHFVNKYNEVLQTLEMLIFQKDYHQLQQKINYYKSTPLGESILTFVTHSLQSYSPNNTLNRAFVADSEQQDHYNHFCKSSQGNSLQLDEKIIEKTRINTALKIVTCEAEPFERKQEAWLGIVYSKNAAQQSQIFNQGKELGNLSARTSLQFSEISVTQAFEQKSNAVNKDIQFSGKKIKSMIFLKEKSVKKKSLPKTSVKKELLSNKQCDNQENDEDRITKKKLNFAVKTNEKQAKKLVKNQIRTSKSYKKQIINSH